MELKVSWGQHQTIIQFMQCSELLALLLIILINLGIRKMVKKKKELDLVKQYILEKEKDERPTKNRVLIIEWMKRNLDYRPNTDNAYFITLRYQTSTKPKDYEDARNKLRVIMRSLYFQMFGRKWLKKLPKSMCVIEKGKRGYLHAHMVVNLRDIESEELLFYFEKTQYIYAWLNIQFSYWKNKQERDAHKGQNYIPKFNDIVIEPVYDINRLMQYITKEFNFKRKKILFDNVFNEGMLFRFDKYV
jgi:hypothetical protein